VGVVLLHRVAADKRCLPYLFRPPSEQPRLFGGGHVGRMLEIEKRDMFCDPHKKEPPESFSSTSFHLSTVSLFCSLDPVLYRLLASITSSSDHWYISRDEYRTDA
jgi:hypothetical protein